MTYYVIVNEARYLLVQNYQEPTKSVLACIENFVFNASLMSGNLCPSTDLDMKLKRNLSMIEMRL